jgi:heme O synthase-like polyprenyltransferase
MKAPSQKRALRVFSWSITYLTLLFVALAADQLVRSGW